jgi:hypothetical protein
MNAFLVRQLASLHTHSQHLESGSGAHVDEKGMGQALYMSLRHGICYFMQLGIGPVEKRKRSVLSVEREEPHPLWNHEGTPSGTYYHNLLRIY